MSLFKQFAILFLFISCSSSSIVDTANVAFFSNETVVYKKTSSDLNLTSLDIYTVQNSNTLKPVVVWIHGGGWAIGDKLNGMQAKVPFFNDQGYIFVSLNYRLSPFPYELNNERRIKHPAHSIDVVDALQWIQNNVHKYGGDASKMVLIGHSAGAHLVALSGTNQQLLRDRNINLSSIKGVISLDTQAYNVPYAIENLNEKDLYLNAFSNDTANQKDASPFYQLDNYNSVISNWMFASRGSLVRREILNDFTNKLISKGGNVDIVAMDGYSHADVNDLISDGSNSILSSRIEQFLATVFQ